MTLPVQLGASPMSTAGSDHARLKEVAQQFEAIFVRQMLSAARSAGFGGDELFGSAGEETFQEMRDSQFADIASQTGTLGFAASIEKQLAQHLGAKG
ncbi:rod-binding protein [Croceibacterium sp. LX-88]|uniref:Rod-binding protein n=1 Tax=Croceibacterium selenioxidans TaxID=2838833 RepID=A0ABS5W0A3_9SPHN|nr:rod-binding protein [Croceibacterium selenioxidans]MBT2133202.1 rod-binding protein [Croceibacterium selenioxidans]